MAISYPVALPTHTGIAQIELRAVNAVAYSQSPFTFAGQAHAYQGQMWQAEVSLPPMLTADAEQWLGFLLSLRGQFGTFLLGDPLRTSLRGTATGVTVTGSAGDNTVSATVTAGQTLLAGDYIQIGTGANATLHKVLQDANTDAAGAVTLEVWPALRGSRTGVVSVTDTVGLFRLASNETGWSSNELANYGITFAAREAI